MIKGYWKWGWVLMGLLAVALIRQWPDGKLHIIMCDVGQGDALIVIKGYNQVLIDGGRNDGKVLACLGKYISFWDRKIEMVVMTHGDSDHSGGLLEVAKRYQMGTFIEGLSEDVVKVDRQVKVVRAEPGMRIKLGAMNWEVLSAETAMKENEGSIVLRLEADNRSALFTGDAPIAVEEALLNGSIPLEPVEVIKIAHHGSRNSSEEPFLRALKPQIALISVGKQNHYGHPHDEVIKRLDSLGIRYWRTDQGGDVKLSSTNRGWVVGY
jgi:competence protein ComEC